MDVARKIKKSLFKHLFYIYNMFDLIHASVVPPYSTSELNCLAIAFVGPTTSIIILGLRPKSFIDLMQLHCLCFIIII